MNLEQARARARELLAVVETMYEIWITNLEEVIESIIARTQDADKILTICTALNTWVSMNVGLTGEVAIPQEVVNELTEQILN